MSTDVPIPNNKDLLHHQSRSSLSRQNSKLSEDHVHERQKRYAMSLNNSRTMIMPSSASSSSSNQGLIKPQEMDIAITLVAISMFFITCQSIKIIPDIYEMIECDHFQLALEENEMDQMCQISSEFIDYLVCLGNLFCCLNSAGNFLFYLLRGKKFRDAFCHTYFCFEQPSSSPLGGAFMHSLDPHLRFTTSMIRNGNGIRSATVTAKMQNGESCV